MQSKPTQAHGPYIVTTRRRCTTVAESCHGDNEIEACVCGGRVIRRAVATFEEAQRVTAEGIRVVAERSYENWCACYRPFEVARSLRDDETTTIPLPNGTGIQVEPATWRDIWLEGGVEMGEPSNKPGETLAEHLIAAYNAAQAEGLMS